MFTEFIKMKTIFIITLILLTQFYCSSETSINLEPIKALNFESENYLDPKIEEFTKLKLHRKFNVISFSNQDTNVIGGCFGDLEEEITKPRIPLGPPDLKLSVKVPNK